MVERKGKVKTKVIEKLTKRNLLAFLKKTVDTDDSLLMTDGFRPYKEFDKHNALSHEKDNLVFYALKNFLINLKT